MFAKFFLIFTKSCDLEYQWCHLNHNATRSELLIGDSSIDASYQKVRFKKLRSGFDSVVDLKHTIISMELINASSLVDCIGWNIFHFVVYELSFTWKRARLIPCMAPTRVPQLEEKFKRYSQLKPPSPSSNPKPRRKTEVRISYSFLSVVIRTAG